MAYFSKTDFFKASISYAAGTNINNLNQAILGSVQIPLFPKDIQKNITTVLSAIDKKIEINQRINSELEEMAKTLFDYWFVQFDFPDTNGKPYKSAGGKMIYNSTLKHDVPEGWNLKELGSIIVRSGTGLNPRKHFKLGEGNNFYITIKDIEQGKINFSDKCDRVSNEALAIIDRRSDLKKGDILFTSIEPVGICYLLYKKPTNWNINESVFTIRPDINKITSEYLYLLLSSNLTRAYCANTASGSVHKGIRHSTLKAMPIIYSTPDIIDKFTTIVSPIFEKQNLINEENQTLKQLKSWLLPMLMNGQVTVKS